MVSTRDRIITATIESFRLRGYHGTSLKQISAAAEAPVGSIYHGFPRGKQELAVEALTTAGAAYLALFEMVTEEADGPVEAVIDFFEGAATVLEETDFVNICPIGTVAGEIASSDEPLRLATEAAMSSWIEVATARYIDAGLAADEAEELATTLVATIEGAFILARARRSAEPVRVCGRQVRTLLDHAINHRIPR